MRTFAICNDAPLSFYHLASLEKWMVPLYINYSSLLSSTPWCMLIVHRAADTASLVPVCTLLSLQSLLVVHGLWPGQICWYENWWIPFRQLLNGRKLITLYVIHYIQRQWWWGIKMHVYNITLIKDTLGEKGFVNIFILGLEVTSPWNIIIMYDLTIVRRIFKIH